MLTAKFYAFFFFLVRFLSIVSYWKLTFLRPPILLFLFHQYSMERANVRIRMSKIWEWTKWCINTIWLCLDVIAFVRCYLDVSGHCICFEHLSRQTIADLSLTFRLYKPKIDFDSKPQKIAVFLSIVGLISTLRSSLYMHCSKDATFYFSTYFIKHSLIACLIPSVHSTCYDVVFPRISQLFLNILASPSWWNKYKLTKCITGIMISA